MVDLQVWRLAFSTSQSETTPSGGVEIKSYETGKVYATNDIRQEIISDNYLINIERWQIEWVFKGCEPSQPLKTLLEQSNIIITIIP